MLQLLSIAVIFFLMLTTRSSNSTLNLLGISSVTDLLLPSLRPKWSYSKENEDFKQNPNIMIRTDTACPLHCLPRLSIFQPRPRLIKLSRRPTYHQNRLHLPPYVNTDILKTKKLSAFPVQIYQAWETDSIIAGELWRNLGLALGAVGLVSYHKITVRIDSRIVSGGPGDAR